MSETSIIQTKGIRVKVLPNGNNLSPDKTQFQPNESYNTNIGENLQEEKETNEPLINISEQMQIKINPKQKYSAEKENCRFWTQVCW